MTTNRNATLTLIALIGLTLSSCSTWNYQHPRVNNTDREKTIEISEISTAPTEFVTVPIDKIKEVDKTELQNTGHVNLNNKNKPVKTNLAPVKSNKLPAVSKTINNQNKSPFKQLIPQTKKKKHQNSEVKNVKASTGSGWIRIMIILFVVGFILLLIGIFLSVFIYGGFWWLFYAFGSLLILAGFVVLILGLLGII